MNWLLAVPPVSILDLMIGALLTWHVLHRCCCCPLVLWVAFRTNSAVGLAVLRLGALLDVIGLYRVWLSLT